MGIHWFDVITILMICIFVFGFIFNDPYLFIQINFFIKVIIALYLMYKFNDFRTTPIKFTILDKKICYSAGFYILLFSFADVINSYFIELRTYLLQLYYQLYKIEKKILQ
jgi:hypothetical protein